MKQIRNTLLVLWFVSSTLAFGQQTSNTSTDPEEDEPIVLSPFTVDGSDDIGYRATSTLAGTRIRTDLRDIGSSISIVNKEFLEDTRAVTIQDVLIFTPNTEVSGIAGNYSGAQEAGAGNLIPEIERDNQRGGTTRMRGLAGADLTRNYYITSLPFDTYNVDRIDVQRGANSALFGLGSPGGIVNHSTLAPNFARNGGRLRFETDQYGTARGSFRLNQVLIDDRVAIALAGLSSHKKFEQEEAYEKDKRFYVAVDAKIIDGIRVFGNFETGNRDRSAVDYVPPNDGISPWIVTGRPIFESPAQAGSIFRRTGDFIPGVANSLVYTLASSGSSSGLVSHYADPNSPNPTFGGQVFVRRDLGLPNPFPDTPGEWMMLQPRNTYETARLTGYFPDGSQPGPGESAFFVRGNVGEQILDRSIFDYRKHLFSGGSAPQLAKWTAYQFGAEGRWFDDRLGVEISHSVERLDTSGRNSLQGLLQRTIYIDPNKYLIDTTDGTPGGQLVPNPGFGKPTIGGLWGGNKLFTNRYDSRATAFAEIKASDFMEEGLIERILGRLRLTGVAERRQINDGEMYSRDNVDFNAVANARAGGVIRNVPAQIFRTGSMFVLPVEGNVNFMTANSLADVAGAGIGAVPFGTQRNRSPAYGNWTAWDVVNQKFTDFSAPTWNLNDNSGSQSAFFAGKTSQQIDSKVLVGQAYLWDETIVLMGSWRNDESESASVGAPSSPTFPRTEDVFDPAFVAGPGERSLDADEDTTSWSIMLHTPEFIKEKLPLGSEISLYISEASNFQPSSGNVTVLNDPIAPITGSTKEKGIIISTLNNQLIARLNWFETGILNRRFDVGGVSSNEGILLNLVRQLDNPDNVAQGFTRADVEAVLPPQGVIDVNGWVPDWANFDATTNRNSGDSGTQDFVSKGYEFEITYNPMRNWTMLMSIGSQETVASNTYPVLRKYAADFVKPTWVDSTFAKNYFINDDSTETLSQLAQRTILDPVARAILQDGFPQIEQRKLRVNLNTSYNFGRDSFLPKWLGDVTVGGGYRWQDKLGVGFGVSQNSLGDYVQDVNKPIYGSKLANIDLFFRTKFNLENHRALTLQINVRDLLDNQDLVPIYANPDGSMVYRFMEGRLISFTGTLEF